MLVAKFEQSFQLTQNVDKTYQSIFKQPIRSIDRYERGPPLQSSEKYLGYVYITDSATYSSQPNAVVTGGGNRALSTERHSAPPGIATPGQVAAATATPASRSVTGRVGAMIDPVRDSEIALRHAALAEREANYEKWIKKAVETPSLVINFDKEPAFLASFRNLLFIVNEKSDLTMLTVSNQNDVKVSSLTLI